MDREKVIKGYMICVEHGLFNGEDCHGYHQWKDDHYEIEKINDYSKECPYNGCETGCVKTLAKDTLALLKEQEWISVKDRLPNCNGCYLVWRPHFYPDKGMPSICYFDGQNTWHDSYGVDFTSTLSPEDVSHWMPLPEQPKER